MFHKSGVIIHHAKLDVLVVFTQFRTLLTGLEECKCVFFDSYVVRCISIMCT